VGEWVSSDDVEVVDTLYRRLSLVVVGSAPRRWLEFEHEPSCARIRSRCALPLLLPLLLLLPGSLLSAPFVINQPQTSDKRHLSCSHHTTHPSNTTSSSFIEISPSVLSCVHGSIDSDSSAPPLLVHPSSSSQLRRTPSLVPPPSNHIRYELDPRRINHLDTHLISDSLQRFGKNFLFILFWTYSTPRVHSGRIRIRTAWTWRKHFTVTALETLAYTDLEHELQIKVRTTNTRRIVTNQGRTVERSTILYRKTTESKSNPINQLEAAV
jgi:hypothetical protein